MRHVSNLVIFAVLLICLSYTSLLPSITPYIPTQTVYYATWYALLIYLLFFGRNTKINYWFVLFLFLCWTSIPFNRIPSYVNAYVRFFLFLPIGVVFLVIQSPELRLFRKKMFFATLLLCLLGALISFILYLLSISLPDGRGVFYGIFQHSMVLGPVSGIAAIYSFHQYYNHKTKLRFLYLGCSFICFLTCMVSGSRIASLASLWGIAVYFLCSARSKYTILLCLFALILIPFIDQLASFVMPYTDNIIEKNETNMQLGGSIFTSRLSLWEFLWQDIKSSPLFGVGFGYSNFLFDRDKGTIEPGNGFLYIWSSTGFFSFLIFLSFFISNFLKMLKCSLKQAEPVLPLAILSFFLVHMSCEGYILSAGAFLCAVFWLTLGVCNDFAYSEQTLSTTDNRKDNLPNENTADCSRG